MRLGVHKCRNWRDILMYQINQATRETALRLYGTPHRNGFPFDPTIDTITVNLNQEGIFLTGLEALSTIINPRITEFTIRTLEGKDIVVGDEMLRPFVIKDHATTDVAPENPATMEAGATDPGATDPGASDPTATDPTAIDPTATDPTAKDPGAANLDATDPGATDPGTTDTGATPPTPNEIQTFWKGPALLQYLSQDSLNILADEEGDEMAIMRFGAFKPLTDPACLKRFARSYGYVAPEVHLEE